MSVVTSVKSRFSKFFGKLFKKKNACIGIYGPPNAGKTTLANRIVKDWSDNSDEPLGSVSHIAHETRKAQRHHKLEIESKGNKICLDVVDTPGLATKIDFHDFMKEGLTEKESKQRSKEATEGVIESVKWLDDLDGVILVMDATENPYTQVNVTVIGNMEARKLPLLIVANKIDLPTSNPDAIREAFPQHPFIAISALDGTNMETFYESVAKQFG
ncbi:Era-like GTP-binding protein [Methanolapillus ohkumae]|uniref:GTPase Der n=1 Tax=Methanolapillus ohkumae TaxID=3028298 RepID=A0AA96VEX7_9EURY|nr:GTPase Der [Methanosarcinaceae archaeon Am2]